MGWKGKIRDGDEWSRKERGVREQLTGEDEAERGGEPEGVGRNRGRQAGSWRGGQCTEVWRQESKRASMNSKHQIGDLIRATTITTDDNGRSGEEWKSEPGFIQEGRSHGDQVCHALLQSAAAPRLTQHLGRLKR